MGSSINAEVADRLQEAADLLAQQGANPFRVGAYRRAARTVAGLDRSLDEIFREEGFDGLTAIPDIGRGIAAAVRELIRRGRWSQLERLRGDLDPEQVFQSVPGIGPTLAERIHDDLGVDSLEALEVAAHDGRLQQVEGVGPRRAAAIRAALGAMLGRSGGGGRHAADRERVQAPPVGDILSVDQEYREEAAAGRLRTITPRRFNPAGEAWLPVLHADRGRYHFTALYSNTARAHELGRTHDWVVVYHYDGDQREGQHTVVTEHRGVLADKRVVRGRESECRRYYEERGEGLE